MPTMEGSLSNSRNKVLKVFHNTVRYLACTEVAICISNAIRFCLVAQKMPRLKAFQSMLHKCLQHKLLCDPQEALKISEG